MEKTLEFQDQGPQYVWTSKDLLDPKVDATLIGSLETGKYKEIEQRMKEEAEKRKVENPKMIVDLIYKEDKTSELGSPGQPYPIVEDEWETFVRDIPEYCGKKIPKVYMVDGNKYTAGI